MPGKLKSTTSLLLPVELLERAELLIPFVAQQHAWVGRVWRSSVLVAALEIGLGALEREQEEFKTGLAREDK